MSAPAPLTRRLRIANRYGLHARPAALFVETCNRFSCRIQVLFSGAEANGKNILDIMTLGAGPGTDLEVTASGEDAAAALEALAALVAANFGEEADGK